MDRRLAILSAILIMRARSVFDGRLQDLQALALLAGRLLSSVTSPTRDATSSPKTSTSSPARLGVFEGVVEQARRDELGIPALGGLGQQERHLREVIHVRFGLDALATLHRVPARGEIQRAGHPDDAAHDSGTRGTARSPGAYGR